MDIFKQLGITDSDGNPLTEDNINPLMGYHIVHNITGRILPMTQRFEIMGFDYATQRLKEVNTYYRSIGDDFFGGDWIFKPMYLTDIEDTTMEFVYLYSEIDHKNFGLFK